MAEAYLRQSTFVDGDLILAEHGNAEFNQLVKTFSKDTGHNHDGTVGGGAYIPTLFSPDGLQSFTLGVGGVTGTVVLDEDTLATNSNKHLATQQSIKAYVDSASVSDKDYTDTELSSALTALKSSANTWGSNQSYSNAVICDVAPTNTNHLTRKDYVDTAITSETTSFLASDNVFTGTNTFNAVPKTSADPVVANDLTRKAYVDTSVSNLTASDIGAVSTSGGSTITAPDNSITTYPLLISNAANSLTTAFGSYGMSNKVGTSQTTDYNMTIGGELQVNGNAVYHAGNKPTAAELGVIPTTGSTTLTGTYRTLGRFECNSYVTAGYGSGGVSLTHNDGYGNANVTFNHVSGTPEQNGNAGRIEVNTDDIGGVGMEFEVKSNVTGGVATTLTQAMKLSETTLSFVGKEAFAFYDGWLRINEAETFGSGIYTGSSIIRTDNAFRIGGNGESFLVSTTECEFQGKPIVNDDFVYLSTGGTPLITITREARVTRRLYWNTTPDITLDASTFSVGDEIELRFNNTSGTSTITTSSGDIYVPDGSFGASHTFTGIGTVKIVRNSNWFMVTAITN